MSLLNRKAVLNTMARHETLIVHDIGKTENMGFEPNEAHLQFLLDELTESGYLDILDGVSPPTYTITGKGIVESKRLEEQ